MQLNCRPHRLSGSFSGNRSNQSGVLCVLIGHWQFCQCCVRSSAEAFAHKQRAFFLQDSQINLLSTITITKDDVVVAFSFSGTTDVVAASVKAAKRQGASVIAITGNPDSIIGRCADFCLRTPAIERKVRIGAVSSRYSQQFICDLIFLCLISKHYEEAEELTLKASNLLSYIL